MTPECLGKAFDYAQRTRAHVYVVVPDERWPNVLGEVAALLYRRAISSGRTWLFPDEGGCKGGKVSVVPVSEEPPSHPFVFASCAWGGVDAQPIGKWRKIAVAEVSWT